MSLPRHMRDYQRKRVLPTKAEIQANWDYYDKANNPKSHIHTCLGCGEPAHQFDCDIVGCTLPSETVCANASARLNRR